MQTSTERLFTKARTQNGLLAKPVSDDTLRQLYDTFKWGPTSANCSPARVVFVRSDAAKAQLVACMAPGNQAKVQQAPVTAIVGMDMSFYERLPQPFPHADARAFFAGTTVEVNFVCALGHGDPGKVFGRSPRLRFDEACRFA